MTLSTPLSDDEARIRALTEEWAQAVRNKNIDAVMRFYAPDVLAFDVMPPTQLVGREAYRQRWQDWFDSGGPSHFEVQALHVVANGTLAFCHAINKVRSPGSDGHEHNALVRATVCFRKIGDDWLVVHEHASVPLPAPPSP